MAPDLRSELEPIQTYRIDLSLPPSERYIQVAKDFAPRMSAITPLFDKVLATVIPWAWLRRYIQTLAFLFLRRVYSDEETEELKGISKASGVEMYFLVALNVLLDGLLGCTSGGVMVKGDKRKAKNSVGGMEEESKMVHFRTLDWGMDELRSVLVVLEFVRSDSKDPGKVVARSITYAGFVGVLTGVRQVSMFCGPYHPHLLIGHRENLSISLNFRPTHNCSTFPLRWHQILVLFGYRPSVTHLLRSTLLQPMGLLERSISTLATHRSAPCYLILCDGRRTSVVEKDLVQGQIRSAPYFIVHTNHDTKSPGGQEQTHIQKETNTVLGMEASLEESEDRMDCIQKKWDRVENRNQQKERRNPEKGREIPAVREETLRGWVKAFPIMNECTHFGCIMDPMTGTIRWLQRGTEE